MSASDRYTRTAIALHWLIAVLVIFQFAWGWWMQGIPKQPVGPRVDAFNLHKSLGLTILALMVVRVLWRVGHSPPRLPDLPHWQATAARANHWLLYAALVVQPLAGYLGSEFSGFPVKFFGSTLPSWTGKNVAMKELMSTVHLATSWVIGAIVVLHVAAAFKHALVDRDGLLARMGIGEALSSNRYSPPREDRPNIA
jgi:cytochrome b561